MSRYVYSCCEADGCLLLYLESTVEEDKLDMVENQMASASPATGTSRSGSAARNVNAACSRPIRAHAARLSPTHIPERKRSGRRNEGCMRLQPFFARRHLWRGYERKSMQA